MIYLFLTANLIIIISYMLVAVGIAPHFRSERSVTRVGGVFFFVLCGLTHLEFLVHWAIDQPIGLDDYSSSHMLFIHIPQAVAILWFVSGLYLDQRIIVANLPLSARLVDRGMKFIADVPGSRQAVSGSFGL